ncbi:MAG: HEAT repeat domain-containing protein, partial [Lentisphaeria bacterium]|nr:HEAT repeat domain-containing protein [Lentisphaeria bacterium]
MRLKRTLCLVDVGFGESLRSGGLLVVGLVLLTTVAVGGCGRSPATPSGERLVDGWAAFLCRADDAMDRIIRASSVDPAVARSCLLQNLRRLERVLTPLREGGRVSHAFSVPERTARQLDCSADERDSLVGLTDAAGADGFWFRLAALSGPHFQGHCAIGVMVHEDDAHHEDLAEAYAACTDAGTRYVIIMVLRKWDFEGVVQVLSHALEDPSGSVRHVALDALLDRGTKSRAVRPALVRVLSTGEDLTTRLLAAAA